MNKGGRIEDKKVLVKYPLFCSWLSSDVKSILFEDIPVSIIFFLQYFLIAL